MTDVIRLFSQHPAWKKVVFYLEHAETAPDAARLLHLQKIEACAVIAPPLVARRFTRELPEDAPDVAFLQPGEALPFSLTEEDAVLVFDENGFFPEQVRHAVGVTQESGYHPFDAWERLAPYAETVDVFCCVGDQTVRSLRWERADSGVELSVIFPMYNVAPYLDKCIRTVTAWKAPYVEFLFVDDGSPDNSAEIVSRYAEQDSRIRLIRKPNGGCASARQKGLNEARGRYVGFIDPDDFVDPTMYKKLLRAAFSGSYEIAFAGYNEYYEATETVQPVAEPVFCWPYTSGVRDPAYLVELLTTLRIAIWRGIYSRAMLERGGIRFYEDIRRFDDLAFKMEVYANAQSAIAVPEHLYYYRMNRPGQDVAADDERLYVHFPIFRYLDATYRRLNVPELYRSLQICKLFTHIYAVQKLKPEYLKEYCRQAKEDFDSLFGYRDALNLYRCFMSRGQCRYFRWIYRGNVTGLKLLKRRFDRRQARENEQKVNAPGEKSKIAFDFDVE